MSDPGITERELADLIVRARSLAERLAEPPVAEKTHHAPPDTGSASAREHVRQWNWAFSRADSASFENRLTWDGLTMKSVLRSLSTAEQMGEARTSSDEPPLWAADLGRILPRFTDVGRVAEAGRHPEQELFRDGEAPPFLELWIPFLRHAQECLLAAAPDLDRLLSVPAVDGLKRQLLKELAAMGACTVYGGFEQLRTAARKQAPAVATENPNSNRIYGAYVRLMCEGGSKRLFQAFPVLARDLCRLTRIWIEAVNELVDRLRADLPAVARSLGDGHPAGRVERISPGLSDRHHRGRQVAALTFTSGLRVIYKPRDMKLEKAYNDFLSWLAAAGLESAPPTVRLLAREGYGWARIVSQETVSSDEETRDYFRRAGALLCLTHLLRATDLHMDNVVATKAGPIVVDGETLLQPQVARTGATRPATAIERAYGKVTDSFLGTGFLSFFKTDDQGRVHDLGGLCGRGGHPLGRTACTWKQTGTDAIRSEDEPAHAASRQNILLRNGIPEAPEDHVAELAAGFSAAYRFVASRREEILAQDGPLAKFSGRSTRIVLRPSDLYAQVQERFRSPKFQREGIVRGFLIDSLNAPFRTGPTRPTLWPLAADERNALEALDIPHFSLPTDSCEIRSGSGETIRDHFSMSGLEAVRRQLEDMSEDQLEQQLALLQSSLQREESGPGAHGATVEDRETDPGGPDSGEAAGEPPLSPTALCDTADTLGQEILAHAIWGEDGSVTWIAAPYLRPDERADHGVSYYLYSGASGIALFLAALALVGNRDVYAKAARAACLPIRDVLDSRDRDALLRQEGIGAGNGLGGIVYTMVLLSDLLRDSEFVELGRRVAHRITTGRIAADRRFDIEGGAAGAILGLSALHEKTGEAWILERAMACGEHLLAHRTETAGGWAWLGQESIPLAGFAHGAAGVAYSLSRLRLLTGQERFLEAVEMAHQYERHLYCEKERNWPVLVRDPETGDARRIHVYAWCHGAPGIALARAGTLAVRDDEATHEELETALATTCNLGLGRLDHMCCGSLGHVDVLLTIGRILERPDLIRAAEVRATRVLKRAMVNEGFGLSRSRSPKGCFQPGFFQGTSGIGYELLRLARPSDLPSVLAFARNA